MQRGGGLSCPQQISTSKWKLHNIRVLIFTTVAFSKFSPKDQGKVHIFVKYTVHNQALLLQNTVTSRIQAAWDQGVPVILKVPVSIDTPNYVTEFRDTLNYITYVV